MSNQKNVTITVELTQEEAWLYAQFLKRVTYGDYKGCCAPEEDPYTMIYAGEKIRDALAHEGFSPR